MTTLNTMHLSNAVIEATRLHLGYQPSDLTVFLEASHYRVLAIEVDDPVAWRGDLEGASYTSLLAVLEGQSEHLPDPLTVLADGRHSASGLVRA
jgi:hypothetical protein